MRRLAMLFVRSSSPARRSAILKILCLIQNKLLHRLRRHCVAARNDVGRYITTPRFCFRFRFPVALTNRYFVYDSNKGMLPPPMTSTNSNEAQGANVVAKFIVPPPPPPPQNVAQNAILCRYVGPHSRVRCGERNAAAASLVNGQCTHQLEPQLADERNE
jgi:hypothetical protein